MRERVSVVLMSVDGERPRLRDYNDESSSVEGWKLCKKDVKIMFIYLLLEKGITHTRMACHPSMLCGRYHYCARIFHRPNI